MSVKSALQWLKRARWKLLCGLLALLCGLSYYLYTSQGKMLAQHALDNGQRLMIPLTEEGEWVGQIFEINTDQPPDSSAEADDAGMAEGQIAAVNSAASEDSEDYPELVVTEALEETQKPAPSYTSPESSVPPEEKVDLHAENTPSEDTAATEHISAEDVEEPTESVREDAEPVLEEAEPTVTPPIEAEQPVVAELDEGKKEMKIGRPLKVAPNQDLLDAAGEYNIPKISKDGVKPWQHYRKEFDGSVTKPNVVVIIHGLGLGRITTENALTLDSHVTLSFSPYAKNTEMWGAHARNIGHEILLDLPQESKNYPAVDPGPYALLNTQDTKTNKDRLYWVMSRVPGYVGFLQVDEPAAPSKAMVEAFSEINNRGLFMINSPLANEPKVTRQYEKIDLITVPYARRLDDVLSRADILRQLALLVKDAKKNGHAIAVARPYPLTIEILEQWIDELDSMGVELAPVSAVVEDEY